MRCRHLLSAVLAPLVSFVTLTAFAPALVAADAPRKQTAAAADDKGIPRFGKFEVVVENTRSYADPYRSVQLKARFSDAYGNVREVDGFYDGGTVWRVRFRPDNPGKWTYEASFSDGAPGVKDTFQVRHVVQEPGPVGIDPVNPIWFRRGVRPFLPRALHIGDRFFADNWPDAERTAFLDWAKKQGYNMLSIASHLLNRDEPGRGRSWSTPKLWPLDAKEYGKMERLLDELNRRGFVVFPFAGFFGKNSNYPRDPADQELYLRYTLARIGHYPNLVFNTAGPEPNVNKGWMQPDEVNRLGRLIRKLDIYEHPLTVHNKTGSDPYRDSDWTTFGTMQGPKTLDRRELARGTLAHHHPAKPLFSQETLWSGNSIHIRKNKQDYSDADLRKHLIVLTFSAASVCFADNDGESSSGFSGSLDPAKARQARHDILKRTWDLLETLPLHELKPRTDLVDNGYALADPGKQYLVYLESHGSVNVKIEDGPYGAEWINAQNASDRRMAGLTHDGRGFTAPTDGEDWILWLRKTKVGLPDQVHLSWTEDPASSLTVTWHTISDKNPARVDYRPAGSAAWQSATGNTFPSPGGGFLHRTTLRGLRSDSPIEYRVSSDRGMTPEMGAIHTTRTAPAPGGGDFSFAFLSDIGLDGRLDGNASAIQPVMNAVLHCEPHFVLGGGDYAYANRDGRFKSVGLAIDRWFEQYQPVLARFPFMAQYGNHEIYLVERFENWAPRFAHPPGHEEGRSYSFDVGDTHFTAFFLVDKPATAEQIAWLDEDLRKARAKGSRWLVVYHHEPIYGFGRSHASKPHIAEALIPVFERHKVDLHLSAHDQNYERTFPLLGPPSAPAVQSTARDRYKAGLGVIYCKVSPAGKKSEIGNRFSRFTVPQQPFMAVRDDEAHHFAIVRVRMKGELEATVYRLADGASEVTVLDRFVLER